jgi:hypothetical protein
MEAPKPEIPISPHEIRARRILELAQPDINRGIVAAVAAGLKPIDRNRLEPIIINALQEIKALDGLARQQLKLGEDVLPKEAADDVAMIWVPSGAGYIEQPFKDDPYRDKPYARSQGRQRLMHAARLVRKISERRSGEAPLRKSISKALADRALARMNIALYGPDIFFNGRLDENKDVINYLNQEDNIIPSNKVYVFHGDIKSTLDQVRSLKSEEFQKYLASRPGKKIIIATHVPHAMRLLHMLEKYKPFSEGYEVFLYPLPIPEVEGDQYVIDEIKGLLYYIAAGQAAETPLTPANLSFSGPDRI